MGILEGKKKVYFKEKKKWSLLLNAAKKWSKIGQWIDHLLWSFVTLQIAFTLELHREKPPWSRLKRGWEDRAIKIDKSFIGVLLDWGIEKQGSGYAL